MCVLSIKVPIQKKSGNLFNDPRIYRGQSVSCFKNFSTTIFNICNTTDLEQLTSFEHTIVDKSS